MKGYVYALHGSPDELRPWTSILRGPLYHWVADAARLTMGQDVPEDWKDQGAVFGPSGELRWWKTDAGYQALLLTDDPVDGLSPLPGEWEVQEVTVFLQNLRERRLKPNFSTYPHGSAAGRFQARVYSCDGMTTFISPRELVKG